MHLLPCTPCFTWQWVSPCVAKCTTCTLKHTNSNTHSAERLCLLSDAGEELFLLSAFTSHPSQQCVKNAKKFLLTRNTLKLQLTQMHTNKLILKEEGSENAKKKNPKRHLASSRKERLEWRRECSPEAWWIDERTEGEQVKASWRQRRPCLVVGWVREGGSFGLLRDRQASFS